MEDVILKKLLENELLSEDTRAELSEQWNVAVDAFKKQVREETALDVRAQLAEQWITERDELVAKVDHYVAEHLRREVEDLRGDVERFRDLEAEYAEKLVEAKRELAESVSAELDTLVDKVDMFLEQVLKTEMDELREDISVVKENEFGRQIFEAFAGAYATSHAHSDDTAVKLRIAEAKLADANRALSKAERQQGAMLRESKMNEVLAPLTGKKREQMEILLKNVDTSRLEESYKYFITRIVKDDKVLNEHVESRPRRTTVVTGDAGREEPVQIDEGLARIRHLAGVK